MTDTVKPSEIAQGFLTSAINIGGATWEKIQNAVKFYVKGFAQSIAEIAIGVAPGEIKRPQARLYARNALYGFAQMISNVCQIILTAVEQFIRKVIATMKDIINKSLPFAIL